MPLTDAASLFRQLRRFADESSATIQLGGESVPVYHTQFGSYSLQSVAQAVYDQLTFDPTSYATYDAFRDALFDVAHDEIETAIERADSAPAASPSNWEPDAATGIRPWKAADVVTNLTTVYDGFEPPEGAEFHYERYGEARRVPDTTAEFVADVFTMLHAQRAVAYIHQFRHPGPESDLTEFDANVALFAMRDCLEKHHGWSVFSEPTIQRDTVDRLWQMCAEVGFDPDTHWVYGLYVIPNGAKRYEPHDTIYRTTRSSMHNVIHTEVTGSPPEMRYTAAKTTKGDLVAHREQMRDQWDDTR